MLVGIVVIEVVVCVVVTRPIIHDGLVRQVIVVRINWLCCGCCCWLSHGC